MDTLALKSVDLSFVKNKDVVVPQYVEFIVNGKPLSEIINQHFQLKRLLFTKFTSVLGTMEETNFDRLKIHQLLAHKITDQDLEKLFPSKFFDHDPILSELGIEKILLYCCAECGDYRCSGTFVKVTKNAKTFTWTINHPLFSIADPDTDENQLTFEFDQEVYHKAFKDYLRSLDEEN